MRVLHVADRLTTRGGAYAWLLGILEGLAADHEQTLAVGQRDADAAAHCPVVVRRRLAARDAAVRLDDLAADAEVVHVHNVTNPALLEWAADCGKALLTIQDHRFFCPGRGKWTAGREVCRRTLSKEGCRACFDEEPYFRAIHALTERRLAAARRLRVSVLSRYMREELVSAGLPPGLVHVVPPFVHGPLNGALEEPVRDPGGAAGPALRTADEMPCVLFVGRLVEAKGIRDAVAAWRASGVPLPLVVAGAGPRRFDVETEPAGEAALEFVGWVGAHDLARLYRRARALLMPSRWQEPFGIAGLEALSFGVPVVAWESGGIAEWHPGPGLVPYGDVPALAKALREAIGRRPAPRVRFERDEALGRLLALYARVAVRQPEAP